MGYSNHSLAEQGQPQTISIEADGQAVDIDSDTTNVYLITGQTGTQDLKIGKFKTHKREGRKLRFMVRLDQADLTVTFGTIADEMRVVNDTDIALVAGDSIEFICVAVSGGSNPALEWVQFNSLFLTTP